MPPSVPEPPGADHAVVPGQSLAVAAESLYLANLLLLPGLAFAAEVVLYRRCRDAPPLARCHLRQTLAASLWAGALLGLLSAAVIVMAGYRYPYTWLFVLLYFVTFHSLFILLGLLGLAKAMAGRHYRFPLFGAVCDEVRR